MQDADAVARWREDVEVLADPERVLQVLSNLLGNAVKVTPRGGTVGLSARVRRRAYAGRGQAACRFGAGGRRPCHA